MKKIKTAYLIPLCIGMLFLQNCQTKKDAWVLKGNVSSPVKIVYLYELSLLQQKTLLDSAIVEKGKFTIKHANADDQLNAFMIDFKTDNKNGVQFVAANGDHLKVNVKGEFDSEFSGTPVSGDFNKYNTFRLTAMNNVNDLSKLLSNKEMDQDELENKMMVFNEKMQDLENEKIEFLKSIQNPELNSYLILNEIISTGVIEKELFGKYVNALTPEGAMTNTGHKIHQIYQVFDAFALSREVNILDTATIRERYNKLDEENKNSEFAKSVKELLETYQ